MVLNRRPYEEQKCGRQVSLSSTGDVTDKRDS